MTNIEDDKYLEWSIDVLRKCRKGIVPSERDLYNLESAIQIAHDMNLNDIDDENGDESY
jgi:hypothetical protein